MKKFGEGAMEERIREVSQSTGGSSEFKALAILWGW
jgi:hypothetical protein